MTSRAEKPNTPSDVELASCLDAKTSFIMVAGAGSGKTTSLVKALVHIAKSQSKELKRRSQKVACITYTEIARDEIWKDVGENSMFHVSTIHSFLWNIVKPFREDIRAWVASRIQEKINDANEKIAKPKTHEKTRVKLREDLQRYGQQIDGLNRVLRFTYGTGSDYRKGILGHDDIIKIGPSLITSRPLLRTIVAQTFPYIFVDESQDTLPEVVNALTAVQQQAAGSMCLGFFGDQMQKIYATGVGSVEKKEGWEKIEKPENFRCPPAVLNVINNIRRGGDELQQTSGLQWNQPGRARMFIAPLAGDRTAKLAKIREVLADEHKDPLWVSDDKEGGVRVLVIVHRMAAVRLGFAGLYSAFNDNDESASLKDGFLKGTGWVISPFLTYLLPLADAVSRGTDFEIISLLKRESPLLAAENIKSADAQRILAELKIAVDKLAGLVSPTSTATVGEVIRLSVAEHLIILDEKWSRHLEEKLSAGDPDGEDEAGVDDAAIAALLACPINEFLGYRVYVAEQSPFSTQHGIKGAEFKRVMTILDDDEGSYSLYSYDKYFRIELLSERDQQNISEGKDSVVDRTRRLFYVSCSRATSELAVVLFASDPEFAMQKVIESGIFPVNDVQIV